MKRRKNIHTNVGGYLTYQTRFQVPEKDWRKSKFLPNCRKDETEGNKLRSTEKEEKKYLRSDVKRQTTPTP